jgi:SulP family sulfate permease
MRPQIKPQPGEPPEKVHIYTNIRSQLTSLGGLFIRPAHILRNYRLDYLRPDLLAALTVAVIMLPQAIAFAMIAELPPQFGLYTAIVASIIGGLWGSSNQLQTGPTNTLSILTLSALLAVAAPGSPEYMQSARVLAVMVGIIALFLGIARLGVLVNFVSDSVIVGFTAGAGMLIIVSQLRYLLGLNVSSHPEFYEMLQALGLHISETHWITLGIGILTIFTILVLRRINPKIPGSFIAIVIASLLVGALGLREMNVRSVSELPKGLPPVLPLPSLEPKLIAQLSTKALAVTAIALVESISIARVISGQTRQRLKSNQEFVGQGLANFASGVFSGYPAAGSFTRSAVNFQSGARTSLASVFAGVLVLIAMLTLGGMVIFIPLAALAGVLIVTAFRLIDYKEVARIWQGSKGDRLIMLITFTAYLIPEKGLQSCPQLGIIEVLGDLYFGAVHHVEECIYSNLQHHPSQRFLLLRMQSVENMDISGIHALENFVDYYRQRGGDVFIERYRGPVLDMMHNSGFVDYIGEDHFIPREKDAIGYLFHRVLDPAVCIYECPLRVFKECQNLPKRLDLVGEPLHLDQALSSVDTISAEDLWIELHKEHPPLIVDVREPREYKAGHIPVALSIPLPKLLNDSPQIYRDEQVIFVCRSGRRSTRIAGTLIDQGYEKIKVLRGGMLSWEAANLLEAVDLDQLSLKETSNE